MEQEVYVNGKRIDDKVDVAETNITMYDDCLAPDWISFERRFILEDTSDVNKIRNIFEGDLGSIDVEYYVKFLSDGSIYKIEMNDVNVDITFHQNKNNIDEIERITGQIKPHNFSGITMGIVDSFPSEVPVTTQDEYLELTRDSAVYPDDKGIKYTVLGLNDEAGEVAGAVKKYLRGDYGDDELEERILSETGDTLWYLTRVLDEMGLTLQQVRDYNAQKIRERMKTDSIQGDGEEIDR